MISNLRKIRFRIFAILFVILLTVVVLFLRAYDWKQSDFRGEPWIAPFTFSDVTKISMSTLGFNMILNKDSNGEWAMATADNFPVAFEKINNFLYRLEKLRMAQNIPGFTDSDRDLFLLNDPRLNDKRTGLHIAIEMGNNPIPRELIAGKLVTINNVIGGKNTQGGSTGRYYISNSIGAGVASETFSMLSQGPAYWFTRNIFAIEHVRKITYYSLPKNECMWAVSRPSVSRKYEFTDGKGGDVKQLAIMEYIQPWALPNFHDIVLRTDLKATPIGKVVVETADALTYEITLAYETIPNQRMRLYYYYFNVARSTQDPGTDVNFSVDGKPIELPRSEAFLQEKIQHEKRFEKWAYLIDPSTMVALSPLRKDLEAKPYQGVSNLPRTSVQERTHTPVAPKKSPHTK